MTEKNTNARTMTPINEIVILGFAFALFGLVLFLGWRSDLPKEEKPEEEPIKIDLEWVEMEEELNKRTDIIGQNGNQGDHYEL